MTLAAALLALSLGMPRGWYGTSEVPGDRMARLAVIAESIAVVAAEFQLSERYPDRFELAAALLVVTHQESGGWDRRVHTGAKKGDAGTSTCIAQVNKKNSAHRGGWASLAGLSRAATKRCIEAAARTLAYTRGFCQGRKYRGTLLRCTLAVYGTGSRDPNKWFEGSSRRERMTRGVLRGFRLMGVL